MLPCFAADVREGPHIVRTAPRSSKVRNPRYTVVLDVNGFLVHRTNRGKKSTPRPNCATFLTWLAKKANIVIWSCATNTNVYSMLDEALVGCSLKSSELVVLSQTHVTTSSYPRVGDKPEKKYMLKDLKKLCEHVDYIDPDRTLLIDDSPEKNLLNEEFQAIHPRTWAGERGDSFLFDVVFPWLERLFASNQLVTEFVQAHPLDGCTRDVGFCFTEVAMNIVTGCTRKWDGRRKKFL